MPRANRHFIQGFTWHITHRCHKQEFLLKFEKDRKRYVDWLFEAKKRYKLQILNYMVTSNHIHLLVSDNNKDRNTIPNFMRLVAGRVAQEYNKRKKRKGAFWEDRYHATAIQTDSHLLKCMLYIDANMVRAGVVDNPLDWKHCGLHEILDPKDRYSIIDHDHIKKLLYFSNDQHFKENYIDWLEAYLGNNIYDSKWSESIAVGTLKFIEIVMEKLGIKRSKVNETGIGKDSFCVREEVEDFEVKKNYQNNMHFWE